MRRPGDRHVLVVMVELGAYLAALWLGVVVLGDGPGQSAAMAGLIALLAVAGAAQALRRPPDPPHDRSGGTAR